MHSPGREEKETCQVRVLSSQVKNCMIWAMNNGDVDAYKY